MNINMEDYLSIFEDSKDSLLSISVSYRGLIGFYRYIYKSNGKYNQNDSYFIEEFGNTPLNDIRVYKDYGISDSLTFSMDRKYLFIVFPELSLDENIRIFNESVPIEATPTGIAVLSQDLGVIADWQNKIVERYPSIKEFFNISENTGYTRKLKDFITELGLSGISENNLFDVGPYLEKLSEKASWKKEFFIELSNTIDELAEKSKGKLLVNSYCESVPTVEAFYSEMYYRYKRAIYANKSQIYELAKAVQSPLYSENGCLVEELYNYIITMPSYMIRILEKYAKPAIAQIVGRRFTLNVKYVPLEDDRNKISHSKFLIIGENCKLCSLFDVWDLNTLEGCMRFKDRLMDLYEQLDIDNSIVLNATNICVFEINNMQYIGYVENLEYEVIANVFNQYLMTPEHTYVMSKITFTKDNIEELFYPSIFFDGIPYCNKLLNGASKRNIYNPKQEMTSVKGCLRANKKYLGMIYYLTWYNIMLEQPQSDSKNFTVEDLEYYLYPLCGVVLRKNRIAITSGDNTDVGKLFNLMSVKEKREGLDCFCSLAAQLLPGSKFVVRR